MSRVQRTPLELGPMSDNVAGIDLERLRPWFREHVAPVGELRAQVIGHGRSNLTYRIDGDGQQWVVRRPPLSHVQPTAHDMQREFRVISALADTEVPVPRTFAICDDSAVIGAPFYVMQYVEGVVPIDPVDFDRRFDEGARRRLGDELVDTLAELHALDPAEVGLADFGRPQGYIERQVRRFSGQLEQVKQRDVPELEEIARRLPAAMPAESDATIVHGDYRLDNTILDAQGHIAAVLDWEMSTLGDPLADLGILRMYWRDREASPDLRATVGAAGVITLPGFPTFAEAAARYQGRTGRDLSNLDFYIVLAHFKLAVILENMYNRFRAGGTVGAGFETIGDQAFLLARAGLAVADGSSVPALRG
jgi:aminoglycoside phosphotransferase (APT) family kinase protein